jgi:hypothetical protein
MMPRDMAADTTSGMGKDKEGGETRPRDTGKPLRILVVEDNPDAAHSLRLLLPWLTPGRKGFRPQSSTGPTWSSAISGYQGWTDTGWPVS